MRDFRVVRLNATLFPPSEYELALYDRYGLAPALVEAATPAEIIPHVADCDALFAVSVALPAAVIERLDRCRVISRLGTGTDKIDVATATRAGILVTNVPLFCIEEQADHTMALLLAVARKLPQMARAMVDGAWGRARQQCQTNQRLSGQTLGLIGFGNSARLTAQRARGFGMRVLATRRNLAAARADAARLGVELVDLDTLLAESDYVSLHLPLGAETYHIIDAAAIRKMKPGAALINTSRGALVDETALVAALRDGHLSGAGLDTFERINVFDTTEIPPDHPLLGLENVVLTPHVAASSVQARQDVATGGVENVVAVLNGRWPPREHIVNQGVVPRFPLQSAIA
jgi:D-3-phosphoglycerate dehydrogenase